MPSDAVDLQAAVIGAPDCPDVRGWPIQDNLDVVEFAASQRWERGDTMVEFAHRDLLPPANGSQGAISYTIWIGCRINGIWHLAAAVECINQYVPTGQLLAPGQVGDNILYYAAPPLQHYQPQPGEKILIFVTTGDTRRQNAQALTLGAPWRTNAVIVPFAVGRYPFANVVTPSWPSQTPPQPQPPTEPPAQIPPPTIQVVPAEYAAEVMALRRLLAEQSLTLSTIVDALHAQQSTLLQLSQTVADAARRPAPAYTGSVFGARLRLTPDPPLAG